MSWLHESFWLFEPRRKKNAPLLSSSATALSTCLGTGWLTLLRCLPLCLTYRGNVYNQLRLNVSGGVSCPCMSDFLVCAPSVLLLWMCCYHNWSQLPLLSSLCPQDCWNEMSHLTRTLFAGRFSISLFLHRLVSLSHFLAQVLYARWLKTYQTGVRIHWAAVS